MVINGQIRAGGDIDFRCITGTSTHIGGDAVFADLIYIKATGKKAGLQAGIAYDINAGGIFHGLFKGVNGFIVQLFFGDDADRLRRIFAGNF